MKPSLIIIGLGNPGEQYTMTRHNVGFRVADKLADEFGEGDWQDKQKFKSYILEGRIVTVPILIAKPNTYMNLSGVAARKLIDFYDLDPRKNLLVICDDIDLPIGEVRLREKGGPGTHNGLKSLVDIFGEEFPRLRIGIGAQPAGEDLAAWVLSVPSTEETKIIDEAVGGVGEIVKKYVMDGGENVAS